MSGTYADNARGWSNMDIVSLPAIFKQKADGSWDKFPPVTDWRNTTLEKVEELKKSYPNFQIGIITGYSKKYNAYLGILDLDVKRKPANGVKFLQGYETVFGKLPETCTYKTMSGGLQMMYFFDQKPKEHGAPVRNGEGIGSGVDVLANNHFAMVPPSVAPNGQSYEYINNSPIAWANKKVYDFIEFVRKYDNDKCGDDNEPQELSETDAAILRMENKSFLDAFKQIPCKDISRDIWIRMGIALKNIGEPVDTWIEWSATDPDRFKEGECEKLWSGLRGNWNGGTIIIEAKKHGYKTDTGTEAADIKLDKVEDIRSKQPDWLIPIYIPKGQIVHIVGDGGVGKTTAACSIMASVSAGKPTFLEPYATTARDAGLVIYFSAEDSTEYVLKERLKANGANLKNILTLQPEDDRFKDIKFNSPVLEKIVSGYMPTLVVFDPLQQFIPPDIHMGERNAMRQCLAPLMVLGKKYGTTFLIVMHTNKRSGAAGRNRMADSADLWDIARSVLIVGETNDKDIRYISHEKSNYGKKGSTILFSIDDQIIRYKGISDKHDADFVSEKETVKRSAPERERAKSIILEHLSNNGTVHASDLKEAVMQKGITEGTYRNARDELLKDNRLAIQRTGRKGKGKGVDWSYSLKT